METLLQLHLHDGNNGFSLNVSIPADLTGSIRAIGEDQYVIGGTSGSNDDDGLVEGTLWALSLEHGQEGTLLWQTVLHLHMTQHQTQ